MIAVEGDTAILICCPGQEHLDKLPGQFIRRIEPAFGLAENLQGNGGRKVLLEQALMGSDLPVMQPP